MTIRAPVFLAIIIIALFLLPEIVNAEVPAPVDPILVPESPITCEYPIEREDNTPFDWATEGGKIRFHYGYSPGVYTVTVDSTDCSHTIINADHAGKTLYIVGTVFDKDGKESGVSNEKVHAVGKLPVAPPKPFVWR